VVLRTVAGPGTVTVTRRDGQRSAATTDRLDALTSASVLGRRGEITLIEVALPDRDVLRP
jgi:hypothetical protein